MNAFSNGLIDTIANTVVGKPGDFSDSVVMAAKVLDRAEACYEHRISRIQVPS
jgi:hypothetical protein